MKPQFMILVADRNPHVRDFLRRELTADGYGISLARDGRTVLQMLNSGRRPDLLVLDLDITYVDGIQVLEWIQAHDGSYPVVVHTCNTERAGHPAVCNASAFFEKSGNNMDSLKKTVAGLLRKAYPERFQQELKEKGYGCRQDPKRMSSPSS